LRTSITPSPIVSNTDSTRVSSRIFVLSARIASVSAS
jgi:hypothetical protein